MSKDIRSYFSISKNVKPKSAETVVSPASDSKLSKLSLKKRKNIILDSDESDGDDDVVVINKKSKVAQKSSPDKKADEKKNLVPVANVADILGSRPAKRSLIATLPQKPDPPKKPKKTSTKEKEKIQPEIEVDVHSDSDFEATLEQLDEIEKNFVSSVKPSSSSKHSEDHNSKKASSSKDDTKKHQSPTNGTKRSTSPPKSTKSPPKGTSSKYFASSATEKILLDYQASKEKHDEKVSKETKEVTPSKPPQKKDKTPSSEKHSKKSEKSSSSKTVESSDLDESLVEGTPEQDKKRLHAEHYSKYIQRSGPAHPGSKEIPKGVPNCLQGLTFVVTGVLDSLDREEVAELIKGYGGKCTSSLSKNTSYVVTGSEPGPSKMEKAAKLGTSIIDEDGLLDLIKSRVPFAASPSPNSDKYPGKKQTKTEPKVETAKQSKTETSKQPKEDIPKRSKVDKETKPSSPKHSKPNSPKKGSPETPKIIKKEGSQMSSPSSLQSSPSTSSIGGDSQSTQPVSPALSSTTTETSMWVDKYKPSTLKQIIGQQGDRSPANKLKAWLEAWMKNNAPGSGKKAKPAPWAKNDDGAAFKAALLSGPPGIGKTTTAQIVCKELGFDVVEFNASDTRSKRLLQDEVKEQLGCQSLSGFLTSQGDKHKALSHKRVLLMEEVDGIAGTQDRGGIQELIALIKSSKVPIICTCNDRNSQKLRSLANHCFDLRFPKPRLEQIRGPMLSLCFKEKVKIPTEALNAIIEGTNHDVRQIIHHLSLWSAGQQNMDTDLTKKEANKSRKQIKLGPWDVVRKVFSEEEQRGMSFNDKAALFFHDYSFGPLFVQENYLAAVPHGPQQVEGTPRERISEKERLRRVAEAADSIAQGDIIDNCLRSNNAWALLPTQAVFASVVPGTVLRGHLSKQPMFPAWLGKNSRTNKFNRLLSELQMHMRLSISGSKEAVAMDYLAPVYNKVLDHLIKEGKDGIPATLETMDQYHLLREDIDSLSELTNWGVGQSDPWSRINAQVRSSFTREYNKSSLMTPYSISGVGVKGGRRRGGGGGDDDFMEGEEGDEMGAEDDEEEDDDDLASDSMIKAKKPSAASSKASSSKGAGSSKGASSSKGSRGGGGSSRGGRGKGKNKN